MYNIKNRKRISLLSFRTVLHTILSLSSLAWLIFAISSNELLLAHSLLIPLICFGSTTAYGIFNLFWVIEKHSIDN